MCNVLGEKKDKDLAKSCGTSYIICFSFPINGMGIYLA
jgi:hypothetical protein